MKKKKNRLNLNIKNNIKNQKMKATFKNFRQ